MSEINPYSNEKEYPIFDISTSQTEEKINIENFKPNDPNEILQPDLENSYINEIHEETINSYKLNDLSTDQPIAYEKNNEMTYSFTTPAPAPADLSEETKNNELDENKILNENEILNENVPEPNVIDESENDEDVSKIVNGNDDSENNYYQVPEAIEDNAPNDTDTDSEFEEDSIDKPKTLCPFRLSIIVILLIFIVVMCYYD
tara:strand:+ start:126 stop:734 length:609 start_codon:yes stop_codon:yes gene_type:complete